MNELGYKEVLILVASITLVGISVSTLVISWFVIRILRNLKEITEKLKKTGNDLGDDFQAIRSELKIEGLKTKKIIDFFLGFLMRRVRPSRARKQ